MTRTTRAAAARAQQAKEPQVVTTPHDNNTTKDAGKQYKPSMDSSVENIDPNLQNKTDIAKKAGNEPTLTTKKSKKGSKKGKNNKLQAENVVVDVQEMEAPIVDEVKVQETEVEAIEQAPVDMFEEPPEGAAHSTAGKDGLSGAEQSHHPEAVTVNVQEEKFSTAERQAEVDTALAALEGRPTPAATPKQSIQSPQALVSSSNAPPISRDAIDEIDALEDALEEIGRSLPNVALSPEKPKQKQSPITKDKTRQSIGAAKAVQPAVIKPQPKTMKATASQTTVKPKVSSSLLNTTQPSATARSRTGPTVPPNRSVSGSTAALKRQSVMAAKVANESAAAKKPIDYLASKRRPISMQFPPPPAPIKSARAPTRPTFTLPGEAISARKKALLEEKLKKEDEELQRRRSFKPRPVPDSVRGRPTSMIVKQNASSRARLSVMGSTTGSMSDSKENISPANTSLKRSNTTAAAAKIGNRAAPVARSAMASSMSKASANTSIKRDDSQANASGPSKTSATAKRTSVVAPHRQPLNMSMSSATTAPRPKSMILNGSQRQSTGVRPTAAEAQALKAKAKSIYNRDCNGGNIHQRERREKEEGAKRARAEAAEKGRQASRDWAERQRKKLAETKLAQQQKRRSMIAA